MATTSYVVTFWNGYSVEYENVCGMTEVINFLNKNQNKIDVLSIKKSSWVEEEKKETKKITPAMVGQAMGGVSAQAIRVGLQQGILKFGKAYKQSGEKNYSYILYPEEVRKVVGETAFIKMMQGDTGEDEMADAI